MLFATIERLTAPSHYLAPDLISTEKCNKFASFFTSKIKKIRPNITFQLQPTKFDLPVQKKVLNTMSEFTPVDYQTLKEIVQTLSTSTSQLDTLPTSFFKSVLHLLAPNILQIINKSLQTGTFPMSLKTAVVKPLLKKNSLDASVLSNYRPISNHPRSLRRLFLIS